MLDFYVDKFNRPSFIEKDPISVPHSFSKRQDIEIAGLWTAVFSWGQRKTIINKANTLMALMDHSPFDFVKNHQPRDRKRFASFAHRTFQYPDTLYFLTFLQHYFHQNDSLETLFLADRSSEDPIKTGLIRMHESFFSLDGAPQRTRKHVSTPIRGSACKRLNMFLRWMVRRDDCGVDFGIWKRISPSNLMIPLDVHVDKVARKLALISRKRTDWHTVEELTSRLRTFDPEDPVKYDFALFGLGVLTPEDWTH